MKHDAKEAQPGLPPQPAPPRNRPRDRHGSQRSYKWIRLPVQVSIAVYVLLIAIGQSVSWSWAANLHTICPFGGVANLYTYFSTGGYVAKLHSAVFVMLLALVLGLVLTGKSFCGWICPLGTVQELLGKIGRRLWPRAYGKVPHVIDRVLRYAKYAILAWILVQTARSAHLAFGDYDPYVNLFTIWSDEIAWTGYLVVGLTVVAGLFAERPFCRYACPLGAVNGFFNSFSLFQIKRDANTCTDCGRCDKACPVGIKVSASSAVRGSECTRCLECVAACPVRSSGEAPLKVRALFSPAPFARKALPVTAFMVIALLAFAVPVVVTNASGDFAIKTTYVYNSAADIKGSSPLSDLVENFPISEHGLYNGFGIDASVGTATQIKDIAGEMGLAEAEIVSPSTFRAVIAALDQSLDRFATEIGADADRLSEVLQLGGVTGSSTVRNLAEQGPFGSLTYLVTGVWPAGEPDGESSAAASTTPEPAVSTSSSSSGGESGTGEASGDGTGQAIKGSTTLAAIKDMVADYPAFLAEFGISASEEASATLRDLASKFGFEVDAARTYIDEHD